MNVWNRFKRSDFQAVRDSNLWLLNDDEKKPTQIF